MSRLLFALVLSLAPTFPKAGDGLLSDLFVDNWPSQLPEATVKLLEEDQSGVQKCFDAITGETIDCAPEETNPNQAIRPEIIIQQFNYFDEIGSQHELLQKNTFTPPEPNAAYIREILQVDHEIHPDAVDRMPSQALIAISSIIAANNIRALDVCEVTLRRYFSGSNGVCAQVATPERAAVRSTVDSREFLITVERIGVSPPIFQVRLAGFGEDISGKDGLELYQFEVLWTYDLNGIPMVYPATVRARGYGNIRKWPRFSEGALTTTFNLTDTSSEDVEAVRQNLATDLYFLLQRALHRN